MKIETMLPLGKVDPGVRAPDTALDIRSVPQDARLLEGLGYDGFAVEETKDDPFVVLALAASATSELRLATAVTIAFPRSPTVMALSAWNIQKLSGGRFTLGLGSQVKGHVQRRYGVAWAPPAPRMREYVQAIRAVWDCWQNDVPLRFHGEHYKLDLMVPLFNPGPIDDPHIPIHLAAVNSVMCRVAGEVADGLRPHPVCTPSYIEECMIPQVRAGAEKSDRSLEAFSIAVKPLVATASDAEGLRAETESTRAKIAFYASTPGYFAAFEHHGLADFADEAGKLSKERRWDEMAALVDDDILHRFAVVGTYAEIGKELVHRFGQLATHCEFSIPARTAAERDALAALLAEVRAAGAR